MIYAPRTLAQVLARVQQTADIYEPLMLGARALTAGKLNKSTPCGNCGHSYGHHCESGRLHWVGPEESLYHCIMQHCECGPCECPAFVNPYNGNVTPWKPPLTPDTPCGKCGHIKKHHCTKGKTAIEVDGVTRGCSHYMQWLALGVSSGKVAPCCTSTACAEVADAEQQKFCGCLRFVSPYARRRQKPRQQTMTLFEPDDLARSQERYLQEHTAARPKTKAEILCEIVREDASCTVAELAEASGMSPSWVRRTLKKGGLRAAKAVRQTEGSAAMNHLTRGSYLEFWEEEWDWDFFPQHQRDLGGDCYGEWDDSAVHPWIMRYAERLVERDEEVRAAVQRFHYHGEPRKLEEIFACMNRYDIPALEPKSLAVLLRLLKAGVRIIDKPNGVKP